MVDFRRSGTLSPSFHDMSARGDMRHDICFRSAGGKLIIVKNAFEHVPVEKALYKCTTLPALL